jgi:hypothetical protein
VTARARTLWVPRSNPTQTSPTAVEDPARETADVVTGFPGPAVEDSPGGAHLGESGCSGGGWGGCVRGDPLPNVGQFRPGRGCAVPDGEVLLMEPDGPGAFHPCAVHPMGQAVHDQGRRPFPDAAWPTAPTPGSGPFQLGGGHRPR